ncbi:MAG: hypothetical protein MN733_16485 [Nitrososphaera sp.]|nr:hypothetical protein [Nitrososphaera sp.]
MSERYVVADCLDKYVRAIQEGRVTHSAHIDRKGERDKTHFHMSDTLKCHRKRILKLIGADQAPVQDISLRRFLLGDIVEGIARSAITYSFSSEDGYKGFSAEWQGTLNAFDGRVLGHYDVIITFPDGYRLLIDIKSCHSKKIEYVLAGEKDEGYFGQLAAYAIGEQEAGRKVDGAMVVYIDKDTMRTHPEWVQLEEYIVRVRDDYFKLIKEHEFYLKTKIVPAELKLLRESERYPSRRKFKFGSDGNTLIPQWTCDPRYCQLSHHCKKITAWWDANRPEEDN